MNKKPFNILSSVISAAVIFILMGMTFLEYPQEVNSDQKQADTSRNQKEQRKERVPAEMVPIKSITLPAPPEAARKNEVKAAASQTHFIPLKPKAKVPDSAKIIPSKKLKPSPELAKKIASVKPIKPTVTEPKFITPLRPHKPQTNPMKKPIKKISSNGDILQRETPPLVEEKKYTLPQISRDQVRKNLSKGRAFLKILEHGSGPDIHFAWPDTSHTRNRLFRLLRKCYGMQVALLDRRKRLFRWSDRTGHHWKIDMDRMSGFTRLATGRLSRLEQKLIGQIRRKHPNIQLITPVRMFPRNFDGGLLGELAHFIKKDSRGLQSISARYRQKGTKLFMEDIRINGRKINRQINLSPYANC